MMKIFRVPYRWLPRTFLPNIWGCCLDVYNGIKNVIRWIPVIWFDVDWDWSSLAAIVEYKLRRSSNLELTVGHHVNSKRDVKRMLVCAELLKRLQADEYFEKIPNREANARSNYRRADASAKADQKYLGKLIGKYLTHWWD